MSTQPTQIEPTFADAIATISSTSQIPIQTRRQYCSALRGIARCFDQPIETIPARYSAVKARMAALHHVPVDWTAKTLANTKSNAKAALLWFRKERALPSYGVRLSPAWHRLYSPLSDRGTRHRLSPLMRFCSASGIEPEGVDEAVLDRFLAYREKTSNRKADLAARRIIAKLWNGCVGAVEGWPPIKLAEPPVQRKGGLAFEDFPPGWQADVISYLEGLRCVRRLPNGDRRQPCKESTIITRKRELVAAANMAVKCGVPVESLTCLADMLEPKVADTILDGYWKRNGDVPAAFTINLAARFVSVAHQTRGISAEVIKELGDLRYALEQHRDEGMTEKNLSVVRLVLTPGIWKRIVDLPQQLMAEARALRRTRPIQAGLLAQIAVAVAIETVAPIRLGNLAAIRLGENLNRPGGPDADYWLTFRKYDVKNRRPLQFRLDSTVTKLIEEYVFDFRPALLRGSNHDWLFPGRSTDHKEKISFSTQIVERVQKATGLRVTIHQYRHAGAAVILKHRPGEIELVRMLLGHKSVETTKCFYIDLETIMANEIFTDLVRQKLGADDGSGPFIVPPKQEDRDVRTQSKEW
jgi:hypothetical protein